MNLRVSRDAGIISAPVSRTVASLGHEFIRSSTLYTVEAQVKQVTGQELLLALLS